MKRLSVLAAVVVTVLMMHTRGGTSIGVSPADSCDPDCTGAADGDKVVNPNNCYEFYYCNGGAPVPYPTPCPDGNYFDSATGDCLPGTCESGCDVVVYPQCPYTCTDYVEAIADAYDCSAYYYCSSSGPFGPNYCDDDLPYFDGTACVGDAGVCCTGYCDPYCDGSGFALMPDPKDCEYFYICTTEEGEPGDDVHYRCDDGEYFDVQAGECVTGPAPDPCPTLCDAAGGLTL